MKILQQIFKGKSERVSQNKTDSANTKKQNDPIIHLYDKYGREFLISKSEWRTKVLPNNIKENWNNPEGLYQTIVTAFNDELYSDVLEATKQLLKIDKNHERAAIVRAIALMKIDKIKEAEQVLEDYIRCNGETGIILTNLAKIYYAKNETKLSYTILQRAVELDPNHENGLGWLLAIEKEQVEKQAYLKKLENFAKREDAWLAKLWLAQEYLFNKELEQAMSLYYEILNIARDENNVLLDISGSLAKNGYLKEAIELVYPNYNPEKHDIKVGFNLLEACLQTKNKHIGEKLLHRLYTLNLPPFKNHLLNYSDKFENLIQENNDVNTSDINYEAITIDKPIWLYHLAEPKWLYEMPFIRLQNIIFIPFAIEYNQDIPVKQKTDVAGRFARGIPLYLSEAIFVNTQIGFRYIQTLANGCFAIHTTPHNIDSFHPFVSNGDRYIITGIVKFSDNILSICLQIWDYSKKELFKEQWWESSEVNAAQSLMDIENYFFKQIDEIYGTKQQANYLFYSRPNNDHILYYMIALEQLLALTLNTTAKKTGKTVYGERHILENLYYLSREIKTSDIGKILLLAGISASKTYGSNIYDEFKNAVLELVPRIIDANSAFDLLSIYIFKLFDMQEQLNHQINNLVSVNSDVYQTWLKALIMST